MVRITYAKPAEYGHRGRNGTMQAHGLFVDRRVTDEVWLRGIVSGGQVSDAARLTVPIENVPDLIKALEALL